MDGPGDVTILLKRATEGDAGALEALFPLVYDELRRLARGYFADERADHTLQPTALVHEAYLRLVRRDDISLSDRREFLAVAAQAMRRILLDHARKKGRLKRGGGRRADPEALLTLSVEDEAYLVEVDSVLDRLNTIDPTAHSVVMLRYFAGLTIQQTAEVLGLSPATVKRNWVFARAWLHQQISGGEGNRVDGTA